MVAKLEDVLKGGQELGAKMRQRSMVESYLNYDITDLTERLKVQYPDSTEEDRLTVARNVLDGQNRFKPAKPGFSKALALAYVNRTKIYGAAAAIATLGAIVGVVDLGITEINNARLRSQEQHVESAIESLYSDAVSIDSQIKDVEKNPAVSTLPASEKSKFSFELDGAKSAVDSAVPFFEKYTLKGKAVDKVTLDNFKQAMTEAENVDGILHNSKSKLSSASGILQTERDIGSVRKQLDDLVKEVIALDTPESLKVKARGAYSLGIQYVASRNLPSAQTYLSQLQSIKSDAVEFPSLLSQVDSLYKNINTVSKVSKAKEMANSIYNESKNYIEVADVSRLKGSVNDLRNLEGTLNQDYKIQITGGVYRDPNSGGARRYYVVVQAKDKNGNVLTLPIANQEQQGRVYNVSEWAEEVPQSVYESVKADKMADQIIDDNYFGEKKKGYLDVESKYARKSQITQY
jgi:hypothetical protein